jgi:hypothetical protein
MAVFEFASVIVSTVNGTEQITARDYRFELIKAAKTPEEKIEIAKHEGVKRLNGKLRFEEGRIYYEDFEIPDEILGASYCNYGHSKKIGAYVNGYIEDKKINRARHLPNMYPFLEDGTIFSKLRLTHEDFKNEFWPTMTSGVQKHLLKCFRSEEVNPVVYSIGIFGTDWNPNQQMQMIDVLMKSYVNVEADKIMVILESMVKNKSTIEKWFEPSKPSKWTKIVEQDKMWWDHINSMAESIDAILKLNPNYSIPTDFPFDEMQSLIISINHTLKGSITVFNDSHNKYCFFDTLDIDGYTVQIPKDSVDMVENGAKMRICVGGEAYIDGVAKGNKFIIFLWRDGQPAICAEKYINSRRQDDHDNGQEQYEHSRDGFQIMFKRNKPVTGALREKIKRFMTGLYTSDKARLEEFITQEFVFKRLQWLETSVGKKMFKELQKAYLPNSEKISKKDAQTLDLLKSLAAQPQPVSQ